MSLFLVLLLLLLWPILTIFTREGPGLTKPNPVLPLLFLLLLLLRSIRFDQEWTRPNETADERTEAQQIRQRCQNQPSDLHCRLFDAIFAGLRVKTIKILLLPKFRLCVCVRVCMALVSDPDCTYHFYTL